MDVALGHCILTPKLRVSYYSLNPCCNGCRTWAKVFYTFSNLISVLILVVMDVALGRFQSNVHGTYV